MATSHFTQGALPPLGIIKQALRDAALSDRPNDAIDVLANALRQLAELARVEVRHV